MNWQSRVFRNVTGLAVMFVLSATCGWSAIAPFDINEGKLLRWGTRHIKLVRLEVNVRVSEEDARINALYIFENLLDKPNEVGFVTMPASESPEGLRQFECLVDGWPVKTKLTQAAAGDCAVENGAHWWHMWSVSFAARQQRRIRLRYRMALADTKWGGKQMTYSVTPGRLWADDIEHAIVRFHMSPEMFMQLSSGTSPDYRRQGQALVWEWRAPHTRALGSTGLGIGYIHLEWHERWVSVRGRRFGMSKWLKGGNLYLPLDFLCEEIGGTWDFDRETGKFSAELAGRRISGKLDSTIFKLDGQRTELAAPAMLVQDKVSIPIRPVGEALGWGIFFMGAGPWPAASLSIHTNP